jgi:DNA-binding response OmpR family regulator
MRILVIEDNERLANLIRTGLEEHGNTVETTASGREGQERAATEHFDVIILDLMLPDHDGVEVCRELRRRGVSTPILMLTALSSINDKVCGLEAGADDYLTKPFDTDELVARVRALASRAHANGATLRFSGIEMDLVGRKVSRDGSRIDLTAKEFALLEYFLRNPERVLTRTNIGERVWNLLFHEESNVIEVYVSRLRRKIDKRFDQPLIHTVIGTGYVLSSERNLVPAS